MNDDPSPRPHIPVTQARSTPPPVGDDTATVFEAVGGQVFFDRLVAAFYRRVAEDDVLLRLYPDRVDLAPARERLALFLGQYWGGPTTYSERRGHPRLRMRHAPFAIGGEERDRWLAAMAAALGEVMASAPLEDPVRSEVHERMSAYFAMAADHLVNQPG